MTKNKLPQILAAILALVLASAASQALAANNAKDILAGLTDRYKGLTSISASYSRTTVTPASQDVFKTGSSQTATGLLTWAKPAQLSLDQKTPAAELMTTDGQSVWWYIPSEKLVYLYKNMDVAGQIRPLLAFLDSLEELNRQFTIKLAKSDKERPGQWGLELKPKNKDELGLDLLTVWCDKNFNLSGFRLKAATGEISNFYLSAVTDNPPTEKKQFQFKIPKGVTVEEDEGVR